MLHLVGRIDDQGKRTMSELKHVSIVSPLDEKSLVDAVGSARALLLPSEVEGFGMPALEAYYVGTPICYVAGIDSLFDRYSNQRYADRVIETFSNVSER